MTEPLLRPIARFASGLTYEDIPEKAVDAAKIAISDWFACAMAGFNMPVCENTLAYLKQNRMRVGSSAVFNRGMTSDAAAAALFNGTASHALDYDDCGHSTLGHPSVPVAPVAFALAQELGLNGKDLIRIYLVGVEAEAQVGKWTCPVISQNGWHPTFSLGVIGAAAAAAAAYGLSAEQTEWALGLAATRAGGIKSNFGTMTKAFHAGLAAMTGIECAQMASCGVTSNPRALEAQDGFFACFAGPEPIDPASCRVEIGKVWDIVEVGFLFKQYPCCSGSHPTIDVLTEYLKDYRLDPEDVVRVHAGVSLLSPRELTCHRPKDAIQAKFSLEFAIAAVLYYGKVELDTFTDEKVGDPRIQAFFEKVDYEVDDELAIKYGFTEKAPVKLDFEMKNGTKIHLERDMAYGNPEKPFTKAQRDNKFAICMKRALCEKGGRRFSETLEHLEEADPRAIMELGSPA